MGLCIPALWIPHRGKQAPLEQVAHWPEVMSEAAWHSPSGMERGAGQGGFLLLLLLHMGAVSRARGALGAHRNNHGKGWDSGGLGQQHPGAKVEPWPSLAALLEKWICSFIRG